MLQIQKLKYPVSAIFVDPPYNLNQYENILDKVISQDILNENSLIIIETDKKNSFSISNKLTLIKEKIYGKSKIVFLKK